MLFIVFNYFYPAAVEVFSIMADKVKRLFSSVKYWCVNEIIISVPKWIVVVNVFIVNVPHAVSFVI